MEMILDLETFKNQTYEVKLLDGSTIHLLKPTQKIVIALMAAVSSSDKIASLTQIATLILNNNIEKKVFTEDWVANELDYTMVIAIVNAYGKWIGELQSNPS